MGQISGAETLVIALKKNGLNVSMGWLAFLLLILRV